MSASRPSSRPSPRRPRASVRRVTDTTNSPPRVRQADQRRGRSSTVRKNPSVRNTAMMPVAACRSPAPMAETRRAATASVSLRSSLSSIPRVNSTMPLSYDPSAAALTIGVSIRKSNGGGAPAPIATSSTMLPSCRSSKSSSFAGLACRRMMRSWLLVRPKRPRSQSQTSIPASKAGSATGASRANGWASSAMSPRPFTRSRVSESRSKLANCVATKSWISATPPRARESATPRAATSFRRPPRTSKTIGVTMVLSTRPTPAETNAQTLATIHAARRRRTSSS